MDFLIVDGEVINKNEFGLKPLLWNEYDQFSRKMWFGFGGIPFFEENLELIKQQAAQLKIALPGLFSDRKELFRIVKRMLNKNRFYRSGFVRFQIFRNKKEMHFVISANAFSGTEFPFRKTGILLNFSEIKKYSRNPFNRHSFYNHTFWKIVESSIAGTNFQNTIILNEDDSVCECIAGNIYMIKGSNLLTPSLNTGCCEDVLRNVILKKAGDLNLVTDEPDLLKKERFKEMDEIFIAGEEIGVQWVIGLENRRFIHHFSPEIYEMLNQFLQEKVH